MPKYLKTAILVDFRGTSGSSPEEEIEAHKERFSEFAAPLTLKVHTALRKFRAGHRFGDL